MRKLTLLFSVLIVLIGNSQEKKKSMSTNYFIIPHVETLPKEQDAKSTALTQNGLAIVKQWLTLFSNVSIDLIYSSNEMKTVRTVMEIAKNKEKGIRFYKNIAQLQSDAFKKTTKGKNVLIVANINQFEKIANAYAGANKYQPFTDGRDNTSLLTITFDEKGVLIKDILMKI